MASLCRAAAAAAIVRSGALRSRSPAERLFQAARSPLAAPRIRRPVVAAALASLESLMPLHSAVAAARLRSCIAADSACWSCLSQGGLIKRI
ncbi:protein NONRESPONDING TO OXYLIPINS 2, mitochondrial-like isoform X1 [Panicum virgatum]|uniref:protein NONRESPONDING TO OXYLIPINS 2, mitochondrial-like isoform X1 n=1 Tax=Panicum virgatum TaxID=38727 RepID=UPI0019D5B209|nr:protein NONRESPONDING TO OXYLIPINS 2, mitochondrial-like isoform X1 [Panicum virgatum]